MSNKIKDTGNGKVSVLNKFIKISKTCLIINLVKILTKIMKYYKININKMNFKNLMNKIYKTNNYHR